MPAHDHARVVAARLPAGTHRGAANAPSPCAFPIRADQAVVDALRETEAAAQWKRRGAGLRLLDITEGRERHPPRAPVPGTRTPKPASALPRGVQAVLVTSSQLHNLDPQLHVPPLLLANTLIAAFARAALPRLDIPLLHHIVRRVHPFRPDAFTFPPLIHAASAHASEAKLHACALRAEWTCQRGN
ncbi:hypothetical protein ZWY2020_024399 [Hordeum vulgare]|nr:hypothetical protein ZWY2020_024399 [Hordeum vulgare]